MDALLWVYLLCALTGCLSLFVLSVRGFPIIHLLSVDERRQVLNRMLLAVGLAGFGLSGCVLVGLIGFEPAYSLIFTLFFTLLFVRSAFAVLKNIVRRKLDQEE
jgi:FtsH-binding integral membrane protein